MRAKPFIHSPTGPAGGSRPHAPAALKDATRNGEAGDPEPTIGGAGGGEMNAGSDEGAA